MITGSADPRVTCGGQNEKSIGEATYEGGKAKVPYVQNGKKAGEHRNTGRESPARGGKLKTEKVWPWTGERQNKQREREQPKEVRQQGWRISRLRQVTGTSERLSKEEPARTDAGASGRKGTGKARQRNPDPKEPKKGRRRNPEPTAQRKPSKEPRVAQTRKQSGSELDRWRAGGAFVRGGEKGTEEEPEERKKKEKQAPERKWKEIQEKRRREVFGDCRGERSTAAAGENKHPRGTLHGAPRYGCDQKLH